MPRSETQKKKVEDLLAGIRSEDATSRTAAWQGEGKLGAAAIQPLAKVMKEENGEVARAAKRGLWQIVRFKGGPEAKGKDRVIQRLIALLKDRQPIALRREVVWMLSEIGGDESVEPLAGLLANQELREDAKAALQRIPGELSLQALKSALASVPEDFKLSVAQSLRQRGEKVDGLPCVKLKPTKKTKVKPL